MCLTITSVSHGNHASLSQNDFYINLAPKDSPHMFYQSCVSLHLFILSNIFAIDQRSRFFPNFLFFQDLKAVLGYKNGYSKHLSNMLSPRVTLVASNLEYTVETIPNFFTLVGEAHIPWIQRIILVTVSFFNLVEYREWCVQMCRMTYFAGRSKNKR